jgi:hypothetical protein
MTKYVVLIDALGLPGEERLVERSRRTHVVTRGTYADKGSIVDLEDDKRTKQFLEKKYIRKATKDDVQAEDESPEVDVSGQTAPVTGLPGGAEQTGAEDEGTEAPLTHKQALVKEAGEIGLDTEGTIPELEARIAKAKKEQG